MAAYIAIFLSLVCIILLSVLLIRFKKLFSTDSIIEKTRLQMNKMITDINNNANRDMELINDSSRRVRALLAEADQKMEQFKQATNRLRDMIALAEQLENNQTYTKTENKNISNIKPVGQISEEPIRPDNAYQINANTFTKEKTLQNHPEQSVQKSLFDDETIITQDGAAYKEVPVITTKIFEEKPVINKTEKLGREMNENILRLFNQGMEIEEIAKKLSCSITEVQFIIDMQ